MKRLLIGFVVTAMLVALAAVPGLAQSSRVIVTDVSPDGGSANVGVDTNISATFNIRMAKSTISNKTFYLKQQGSSAVVPSQVTYSGTTKTATLNPNNDLAYGATYTTYVKGGRTGVRGAGGQKLGGTTDGTATFANAKVSWTFTVAPDTTGPSASITDTPPSLVNSRSASFAFSGAEDGGSYQCKIDGVSSAGTFSACSSGESFTVEADGTYTFSVRASDALGNFGTPASHTWMVDTIAPTVNNVSPADAATGVAPSTNVTATFSEAMDSSSISSQTFTLKQGSSSPVAATVSYNSTTREATLNPGSDLASNTTYTATLTTGMKDLAGNALPQERSWTFTTDDGPSGVTVTPTTLDLSPTDVLGCARSEYLTVTNNGPGDVTFADVSITGTDAKYFSDGAKSFILNNGPFTVLDGNHFFDQVTFSAGPTPAERNSDKVYRATLTYKDATGATIGNPVSLTATARCLNFG